MEHPSSNPSDLIPQDPTPTERERLVRYCARFTGDAHAAEDLAQQTLLEAWRRERTLRHPQARQGWLLGIARNLCLMWARGRTRETSRLTSLDEGDWGSPGLGGHLTDDFDLEVELEREDLARLLDRGLALLPPATRQILVERYVEESPQAEIAGHLGLSEGAVEARVHRGKLALRRILGTDLRDEARSYGLVAPESDGWQETRIWCPFCGRHRLTGRFTDRHTELTLHCTDCSLAPGDGTIHRHSADLFADVRTFRPALTRLLSDASRYYAEALARGAARCLGCGMLRPLMPGLGHPAPAPLHDDPAIHVECPACEGGTNMPLTLFALALPEAQEFWRRYPRLRALPVRELDAGGRAALLRSFESGTDAARLEIVFDRDTWIPVSIYGDRNG